MAAKKPPPVWTIFAWPERIPGCGRVLGTSEVGTGATVRAVWLSGGAMLVGILGPDGEIGCVGPAVQHVPRPIHGEIARAHDADVVRVMPGAPSRWR